jgi:hypothetical protein
MKRFTNDLVRDVGSVIVAGVDMVDSETNCLPDNGEARSIELIREIPTRSGAERVSEDPQRLALLLWSGLHGVISLRINKPTLEWPRATELAEQITRAIIRPSEPARARRTRRNNAGQL